MLIVGERHLAAVLDEYTRHFNGHRPHRSLFQRPPVGPRQGVVDLANARIIRRPILGGLINEFPGSVTKPGLRALQPKPTSPRTCRTRMKARVRTTVGSSSRPTLCLLRPVPLKLHPSRCWSDWRRPATRATTPGTTSSTGSRLVACARRCWSSPTVRPGWSGRSGATYPSHCGNAV